VGTILQPTWRLRGGRPVVQLFGRLDGPEGAPFLIEDDRVRPAFFVPRAAVDRLRQARGIEVRPTALRDLAGRALLEVLTETPAAVARLRERLGHEDALEADVRFAYRYLIDRGLRAGVAIEGEATREANGLLRFENPALAPAESKPAPRFLSLDLETTPDASRVLAAALVGAGADEVHLLAAAPVPGAIVHPDEPALLRALLARIAALDPDVLLGWNVVDFDLRVLAARCEACGVPAELGRVPGALGFQQDLGFTRQSRALVPGRMVLDGIALVRDALKLADYRLETVARAVLGRGKRIEGDGPERAAEIERLWREDPVELAAYNREDARLVLDILEHEGLLALTIERSLLSGMQLDRVGASIASFDLLYLPALRERGFVAPSVAAARAPADVRGGALLAPVPGLHRDVAVFDFKSLYPSLIRTFQLDPLAHALVALDPEAARDPIVAPNGARFARAGAILPGLIERYMAARAEAKRRGDRHADQAIKIMLNALFGVLGAPSCRFFDPAIANAITGFGQQTLRWTADAFAEAGVQVLYGDTDSVFVATPRAEVEALRARVEAAVAERIRRELRVEPQLELEFDTFYERLWLSRVRGGGSASHKRYAGWAEGELVVVGLEAVRRDWPAAARRLQLGLLERLFTDQPLAPFARELVERVLAGELDQELVFAKRIRKGSADRYTATTPPHVQAARKLAEAGVEVGPVVRYVVTAAGPAPVRAGRPLPPGIDRLHYVETVLAPIGDAILAEVGERFDEAIGRPKPRQLGLFGEGGTT
jgi:DNA polymerase-2